MYRKLHIVVMSDVLIAKNSGIFRLEFRVECPTFSYFHVQSTAALKNTGGPQSDTNFSKTHTHIPDHIPKCQICLTLTHVTVAY